MLVNFKNKLLVIFESYSVFTGSIVALSVEDRGHLTKLIHFLNQHLPLSQFNLNHLKRIDSARKRWKDIRIVVAPLSERKFKESDGDKCEIDIEKIVREQFSLQVVEFLADFGWDRLTLCQVPLISPLTRPQFEASNRLWPVNFHENK